MNTLGYLLSGGFLKGYRTYLLGGILIAEAVVSYAVGDITLTALYEQLPMLTAGLGLWTARVAVK